MGLPVPVAPARHLIKKYANRKLYDTRTSRYITLEGIAQLVREGHEIEVVDRDHVNERPLADHRSDHNVRVDSVGRLTDPPVRAQLLSHQVGDGGESIHVADD